MKRIYIALFTAFFLTFGAFAYAQTAPGQPVCTDDTSSLPGESASERNARLSADLAQCQREQDAAQATLTQAQNQSASLSRDIKVLDSQIKVAELNIQTKNLLIATLGRDISDKNQTITELAVQIQKGKDTTAELLRKTYELDATTLPDVLLSHQNLTDIFSDLDTFGSVEKSLGATIDQINGNKVQTENQRDVLATRQNQEIDARAAIQQDRANIKKAEADKQTLLNTSKGNEATYGQILAQKQAKAASIRAALFSLAGAKAIPFGQALQYAQTASKATGVGTAFLLAILTQESALGANVGQCYVTNMQTGSGISVKTSSPVTKVMNPSRDTGPFQTITSKLGFDASKVVVSCPLSVGWGGAMGPAQFIPSTWVLLQGRVASALGEPAATVNPWNPQDAFTAAALYLSDLGARAGSYSSERTAACKYYSGRACGLVTGNTSYANSVLSKANDIQLNQINPLEGL